MLEINASRSYPSPPPPTSVASLLLEAKMLRTYQLANPYRLLLTQRIEALEVSEVQVCPLFEFRD